MKTLLILAASLTIMTFNSQAADLDNWRTLHTNNCLACHTSNMYTSKTRKVHDLAALSARVKRCDFSLGTQWFDEDIADVVAYLNHDYYKFK
jgi:mono/diheme cytochrome c family protein